MLLAKFSALILAGILAEPNDSASQVESKPPQRGAFLDSRQIGFRISRDPLNRAWNDYDPASFSLSPSNSRGVYLFELDPKCRVRRAPGYLTGAKADPLGESPSTLGLTSPFSITPAFKNARMSFRSRLSSIRPGTRASRPLLCALRG